MKRLHVHVTVERLAPSVAFYTRLFGSPPGVEKPGYAKWMLDDPRVNFAISEGAAGKAGIDHLGIQVEDAGELADIAARLKAAHEHVVEQAQAACCHAISDKAWVADPQGVAWETFLTTGEITDYGADRVDARNLPRRARA
jgi:catechol 2,3-dioxygenase-like lactoylglutathione lyase family enzyme